MATDNYFSAQSAAQRYAQGRPSVHAQIVQRIQERLPLEWPVPRAIDVACGTGLSTVTLKPVAQEIVGTDISEEMIRLAPIDSQIMYVVAPAENLPFPDAQFDLLTLCNALHWLDTPAFLEEAQRVLRPGGHMVVYYHAFTGTMEGSPAFHSWMQHVFLTTFPMPPRHHVAMPQAAKEAGFLFLGEEHYSSGVRLSPDRLVDYMVSRSNVIAAVEGGDRSIAEVRAWLDERIGRFFGDAEERDFRFGGPLWYFVKA